jgi:hypothetical protein
MKLTADVITMNPSVSIIAVVHADRLETVSQTAAINRLIVYPKKQPHCTPWWRLGERKYSSYSFLTSALDRGEWLASRPGRALPQGKDPRYPLYRKS